MFNPLSAKPTKWSNTLKQFVGKLATNCLSVFDHFVGLALKGLRFSLKVLAKINIKTFIRFELPIKRTKLKMSASYHVLSCLHQHFFKSILRKDITKIFSLQLLLRVQNLENFLLKFRQGNSESCIFVVPLRVL